MKFTGRVYKIIATTLLAAILYFACKKTEVTVNEANIKMINASPGSPGLDLHINGKLVAQNVQYADSTTYDSTSPGTYATQVTETGQTKALFNFIATLSPSRYYTVFSVGNYSSLKLSIVEDKFFRDTTVAKVRFFNFVPNGDTVDVLIRTSHDTLYTFPKRRFNDQDSTANLQVFTSMRADTCNILIRKSRDSSKLYTTGNILFPKGTFHTFYFQGLKGGTGKDTLSLKHIRQ